MKKKKKEPTKYMKPGNVCRFLGLKGLKAKKKRQFLGKNEPVVKGEGRPGEGTKSNDSGSQKKMGRPQ